MKGDFNERETTGGYLGRWHSREDYAKMKVNPPIIPMEFNDGTAVNLPIDEAREMVTKLIPVLGMAPMPPIATEPYEATSTGPGSVDISTDPPTVHYGELPTAANPVPPTQTTSETA